MELDGEFFVAQALTKGDIHVSHGCNAVQNGAEGLGLGAVSQHAVLEGALEGFCFRFAPNRARQDRRASRRRGRRVRSRHPRDADGCPWRWRLLWCLRSTRVDRIFLLLGGRLGSNRAASPAAWRNRARKRHRETIPFGLNVVPCIRGGLEINHHPRHIGLERSEEHTSELQSLAYLVCRLLLEKKK